MSEACAKKLLANKYIEAIYEDKLSLYHDEYTHVIINNLKCCHNSKTVDLSIMKDEEKISDLVKISYLSNHDLVSDGSKGRIVYYHLIILKENFIGKGIIKAIHCNSALSIYKNKFEEIQLHAICDGIISWIRLGFSFAIEDSKYLVYESLMRYLEEVKQIPEDKLDEIEELFINNDGTLNEDAFRKIDKDLYFFNTNSFTKWLYNENIRLSDEEDQKPTIKMYKKIEHCKDVA